MRARSARRTEASRKSRPRRWVGRGHRLQVSITPDLERLLQTSQPDEHNLLQDALATILIQTIDILEHRTIELREHTQLITASGPIVINPVLYRKVAYDPVNDFAPVSQITCYQYAVVVRDASPIRSLQDLVATAKANPGTVSYGSTGIGGGGHLAGVLFEQLSGAKLIHVPYKGGAAVWSDLLGGQLTFTFEALVTAAPMMKSGKLRAFAITGAQRSPTLPQLPTLAEVGFKGYDITQFQGMLAPAKTDPAIVEKLYRELAKIGKSPDVMKRLGEDGGNELIMNSPAEFASLIKADLALYGKLIKDANITSD